MKPARHVSFLLAVLLLSALLAGCKRRATQPAPPPMPSPGNVASPGAATSGGARSRYADPASWLCLPGRRNDPCASDLTATELRADGSRAVVQGPLPAESPAVDCFYVYPTVDMRLLPGNHTDFADTTRIAEATRAQVANFRGVCDLYVPLYRQVTIGTYGAAKEVQDEHMAVAAADVLDAFREYLAHDHHGRKIVLLGHSQGAEMIVRVLGQLFDDDPAMRARLLVAMPIGGHMTVPRGKAVGGTFKHLPVCTRPDETGCVVGYRSIVAGAEGSTREDVPPGSVSVCVNPTALDAPAHPTARSYFLLTDRLRRHMAGGDTITTPFVLLRDYYGAACVEGPPGVFSLAMSTKRGDPRESPIDFGSRLFRGEMGLHLVDFQLAQGDLIDIIARRAKAVAGAD